MDDKKTESVTVKLPEAMDRYVKFMAELNGVAAGGFIRDLVARDMERTAHELNLRASALGAKVIHENIDYLQK